ncbi:VOC family protein [Actinomadura flavalba]|uniref:VOC family protein n=1 Tax=Actinomadura flavalba TaxID=1120938 RepID=UPI0003702AA2|nr:VOC family protein [Actinomadura flavalba]
MTAAPGGVPELGSILLGTRDPGRLLAWYERCFGAVPDGDGFLRLGGVGVLIDPRQDVAPRNPEPGRVLLNLHVPDARATARHLDAAGVSWVAALEYRDDSGAWFGTVADPDGNHVQIIELTPAYWSLRRERLGLGAGGLAAAGVATRLPAQDLDRARRFFAEKLGLEPAESRPGGLRYRCGAGSFAIFESQGEASGEHTQMGWSVADLAAVVAELRERGVRFERFDMPGLDDDGIVEVKGHYPSEGGVGERAVWFYDSEGNLHGIGQAIR